MLSKIKEALLECMGSAQVCLMVNGERDPERQDFHSSTLRFPLPKARGRPNPVAPGATQCPPSAGGAGHTSSSWSLSASLHQPVSHQHLVPKGGLLPTPTFSRGEE